MTFRTRHARVGRPKALNKDTITVIAMRSTEYTMTMLTYSAELYRMLNGRNTLKLRKMQPMPLQLTAERIK